jgi:hypothetical protein
MIECTSQKGWCRERELNPQGAKHRRILSSLAVSDPFGNFSTLFDFLTGYKATVLIGSDPKCSVPSMELLQFYYGMTTAAPIGLIKQQPDYSGEMLPDQGRLKNPLRSSIRTTRPTTAPWRSNELTWKS